MQTFCAFLHFSIPLLHQKDLKVATETLETTPSFYKCLIQAFSVPFLSIVCNFSCKTLL